MKKISIIGLSGNSLFYELDKLPIKGETLKAKDFYMEVGGKGYNQAIACKRLGLDVYYLSAIGDDINGKACIEFMEKEGVNHKFVIKDAPTATASILKASDSSNEVIVYHGANNLLDINDLKQFEKYIINSDCLLLTYEIPYDVLKEAVKIAKENNILLVINPAPYIYDDLELLKEADIICPNEVEFEQMCKTKIECINQLKEVYLKSGLGKMVITLGSKGACICDKDKFQLIDACKVDAIDTTGAGDVFNAALCFGLLNEMKIEEACNFASLASGISVTRKYVMNAIPNIKELIEE